MNSSHIIAFVGMPGSGKGICTDYMADTYDFPVIHFGNMVYDEVQKRGLDNVKDEKFVREDMRQTEGPAVMAKRVAEKTREYLAINAKAVILDGLYSWSEYKYLREQFGEQFITVAITAPRADRHHRVVNRKDTHRSYTHQQIHDREVAEIENLEKGGPIAFADYTIVNNKTVDDMLADLEKILKKLAVI